MSRQNRPQKKGNAAIWIVVGAGLVVGAALIGANWWSAQNAEPKSAKSYQLGNVTVESDQQRGAVRNVMGSPDAKVTLTEWNDYL